MTNRITTTPTPMTIHHTGSMSAYLSKKLIPGNNPRESLRSSRGSGIGAMESHSDGATPSCGSQQPSTEKSMILLGRALVADHCRDDETAGLANHQDWRHQFPSPPLRGRGVKRKPPMRPVDIIRKKRDGEALT